ncbi:MAG: 16S rRNA (cytosine(967)-C(5))-methyltransferase RsmB, partial [Ruminococcaceae bacterium]|nr:16S rRNA (cytosine(967)-C(5))-methyltransferase RsmB [Oscillospiraceae bacterium]
LPAIPCKDEAEYLSVCYSHPKWLVERLLSILGREETEDFLRLDNESVPMTIQRNSLRCDAQALLAKLEEAGATVIFHPWLPDCWEVTGAGNIEELEAFQNGWFQVQDAAAKTAALAAGAKPGDRVLDVCAAPGGKSFAVAMAMENQGQIISCDIHEHKLSLIESSAQRLGITCVETALADGRENREEWNDSFDLVICDVPCSGLGIIRKKPDIRYKDPKALAGLPRVQRAILDNACRYVKNGGTLLYSTCTVLPEENDAVVEDFLRNHSDFHKESFQLSGRDEVIDGSLTLWPQRHDTDGFYLCRMRKL